MKYLAPCLKILVTLPVVAFLLFVTVSNRDESLRLTWSPLSEPLATALPPVIFVCLVLGFVWGCLIMWSNSLGLYSKIRGLKKQVANLENQLALQKAEHERHSALKRPPAVPPPTPRIAAPEIL